MNRFFRRAILVLALFAALIPLSALEIYRPENYGDLNRIPCLIRVTSMDGADASAAVTHISYNWYYELPLPNWSAQPKTLNRWFDGCFTGGAVVHLLLKSGAYKISVYTPKRLQQDYTESRTFSAPLPEEWASNEFVYDNRDPENRPKVIFVSPVADDNGFFAGSWHIDYRAPRYYRWTKPAAR